ncbi:hypothetical protein M9Y10_018429 [Tritrichomonas musculus]|uniref:Adenylate and Guanylate cyclase catalytic domain containing protein n=1 Tax=Tritrichomonas musculus TaxID=1915356 RepID=A0ABR2HNK3_9EUKA
MDQSITRSVLDGVATGTRSLLIQGKYSRIDILFPLFDQMAQLTKIPSSVSPIFGFYYALQTIFSCFWPNTIYWSERSSDISTISILSQVFWFLDITPSKINFLVVFFILLVLTILLIIYFIGVLWFYQRNLRFRTWSLYTTRYIIECFIPILLYPSASLFGSAIYILIYEENRIYWIYAILSLLILITITSTYYIGHATLSHSCCISITIFSSFDVFVSFSFYTINMVTIILSYMFYEFPHYSVNVFQGVRIILLILLCIHFFKTFPFHHRVTNIFHLSILLIELLGDFVSFISFLSNKPNVLINIISTLVFIVAIPIVLSFVIKFIFKKIVNDLSPDEDVDLKTDSNCKEYFDGLGLSNKDKSILYLHVGFTQMAPLFLNWTLPKYMYVKNHTKRVTASVIQIVSFFPSEKDFLNQLFAYLSSKPELSFAHRFLVYQTYRIKSLRQSSSSSDANDRLAKLRSQSNQCLMNTLTFWNAHEPSLAIFESLSQEQRRINSLWVEAIRDFPNSPKLYDECATFLIECMCEFRVAITMKKKCELIETGSSFAVDASFRSMVWSYPAYVKQGILDVKGAVLERHHSSVQNTELIMNSTDSLDVDSSVEFEENIGKNILNKSKLRLAFDSALKTKTHSSFSAITIISIITLVISVTIYFFLCFYIRDAFSIRKDCVKYINYLGMSHFHTRLASFAIITRFIESDNRIAGIAEIESSVKSDGTSPNYIQFTHNQETALRESSIAREYFSDMILLLDDLVSKSNMGDHEVELMTNMIDRSVPFYQCSNRSINKPINMNFHSVLSYCYFIFSYLLSKDASIDYYNNDLFCEAVHNQISLFSKIDSIYKSFISYADEKNVQLQNMNKIFSIIFPLIMFIISFIPLLICALAYVKHVNKITSVLLSFDKNIKNEILTQIRKDVQIDINTINEPHVGIPMITPITILCFIFALLTTMICFGMTKFSNNNCDYINKLNVWTYHAVIRLISSVDLLIQVYHTLALNETNSSYFFTRPQAIQLVNNSFRRLVEANKNLLRGDSSNPAIFEVDSRLDDLNYNELCQLVGPTTNFHDAYKCSSCDKLVASLNDLLQPIILFPEETSEASDLFEITQMFHILNSHFWYRCVETIERLTELADASNSETTNMMYVFLVFGIVCSFLVFIGGFILKSTATMSYRALLGEMKRIPPHLMIANKDLKNFLLNKDEEKDTITSDSRSVLHNSSDAMMCVNLTGVVEMVNPAVTATLGFTPEQVLGQPIMSFFHPDDANKIIDEMQIIVEGQNGTVYEDHMQCITDNSTLLPVATTLLGMQLEDGVSTQSFVIILRNESELIKRQQDAEEAKSKSENLLLHILPEKVIMMINQGEKDICFTVPNTTICYLDVVKFSEYSKTLQPHQILGSLSCLFSSFDNLLYSYPLIIKIKLIGDIYMAAAGLFTDGDKAIEHANQTVKFGLEALMTLDDVNVKLDASLQVRCGINTGGPIIAGVLGTDKPVFDIIGDTINVAARLQTTDIPGNIQTTQNTVDLLDRSEFNIQPRGEVFLKGKGKVMTYLISNDLIQHPQPPE